MKCLIIDDEFLARELLANHASKVPDLQVLGKFSNPLEAIPLISKGEIDLLFLDIQMPEITGVEFLKTLQHRPSVVLTTAYSEYALQAFDLDVADYLVKPIGLARFLQAVNKVRAGRIPTNPPAEEFLILKTSQQTVRLPLSSLLFIEGQKEYVCYYTTEGQFTVLESLKNIEANLPGERYIRVHKSYIVSLPFIRSLEGNELHIDGGFRVAIGPSYRAGFLEKFLSRH